MPKVWSVTSKRHFGREGGFSPVEILLAATVFGFMVTALVGAVVYGRQGTADAGNYSRAMALAEEGLEAARNIRDSGLSNLTVGTFGLDQSGNIWVLSGSSDSTDIFTRSLTISNVSTYIKQVQSTVTWNSGNSSVAVSGYLSSWATTFKAWTGAVLTGSADISGSNGATKVATQGTYAYVVRNTGTPNFLIYDISMLNAPALVGSLTLAGNPTNIEVSGNYAYITNASDTAELQIVSVANPASPSLQGTYNATGTGDGTAVGVRGNTVYFSRASDSTTNAFEMTLVNVANPSSPTLIGGYNNNVNMTDIYVPKTGTYVYVATASNTAEVMTINIATPGAPTLAGSLDLTGNNDGTAITGLGNTLFVGQGAAVRSVNITTPTAPTLLGSVTPTGSGTVNSIVVQPAGLYAYIGTSATSAEFQVLNIATPSSMTIARVVDVAGTTSTVNGVAYNSMYAAAVGAGASTNQEFMVFTGN